MTSRVHYVKPSITDLEIKYANDAVSNGWGERCYYYIDLFEQSFKDVIGSKFAIATSSCTGAMHMGLSALGIGEGDEVILADTNWIATVSPIVHVGAKPIFVDIRADSWCIDPYALESAITERTRAIIATHLYGNLCDIDAINAIAEKHNLFVIEDAAEAIGAIYKEKNAGSMGVFGVFSFHGTKTLTTGEGGMLVTDDPDLFNRVLTLSNHGRSASQSKQFWPDEIGYKYKISNVQAAIGCAQVKRIDELVSRKIEILDYYREQLSDLDQISLNPELPGSRIGAWMPSAVLSSESNVTRERMLTTFKKNNIDARVFFWPLSGLPMFSPVHKNINSWSIPSRAINLPSYHDMSFSDQDRVINVLRKLVSGQPV